VLLAHGRAPAAAGVTARALDRWRVRGAGRAAAAPGKAWLAPALVSDVQAALLASSDSGGDGEAGRRSAAAALARAAGAAAAAAREHSINAAC